MYTYLLEKRQAAKLPPYTFLLKLTLSYKTESATIKNAQMLFKKLRQLVETEQIKQVAITPPMPAFHERSNAGYNWQISIRAKSRNDLIKIFDQLDKNSYLHHDFDPYTLL